MSLSELTIGPHKIVVVKFQVGSVEWVGVIDFLLLIFLPVQNYYFFLGGGEKM